MAGRVLQRLVRGLGDSYKATLVRNVFGGYGVAVCVLWRVASNLPSVAASEIQVQ